MKRLVFLCIAMLSLPAFACSGLQAKQAWLREAPPGALVMAGYVTLENSGARPVTLRRISGKDFGGIEIHRTVTEGGQARMEMLDTVTVPAHGAVSLAPGGMHLMLFRAARAFRTGDTAMLNLYCERKQPLKVEFSVKATP